MSATRAGGPRPPAGPTEVRVSAYLVDLIEIRDAHQSFLADVFFRSEWRDARLVHEGPDACRVDPDLIWTPRLLSLNRRAVDGGSGARTEISPEGRVSVVIRIFGEFSFAADLDDFPFDRQSFPFEIVAGGARLFGRVDLTGVGSISIDCEPSDTAGPLGSLS